MPVLTGTRSTQALEALELAGCSAKGPGRVSRRNSATARFEHRPSRSPRKSSGVLRQHDWLAILRSNVRRSWSI